MKNKTPENSKPPERWEFEVFYDRDCPLCRREIQWIQKLDRRNRILFTDISSPQFHPEDFDKTRDDFMDKIHGRTADGTWVIGVEVFRKIYTAVGFGWLVWPSRLPGIRHGLDLAYRWFAKNRLRITGRCTDSCERPEPNSNQEVTV